MSAFIETFTGRKFCPLDPWPSDIRVEDIAHGLSNLCRFSGHVKTFYSVAEHSVRVSWLLQSWGCMPLVQKWGLFHDASECLGIPDFPAPIKKEECFANIREAEHTIMRAVCDRFWLPYEEPPMVKKADLVLLSTEARDLMFYRAEHWAKLTEKPLDEAITPWSPSDAKARFLLRFMKLEKELTK